MTETTATRLAAAIVNARSKVIEAMLVHSVNREEITHSHLVASCPDITAALARLERLCVARGKWEQANANMIWEQHYNQLMSKIEALLREET